VPMRYHGTLFGLIRCKPVLSIFWQRKSEELMRQMGQAEYAIDVRRLTLEMLQERFLALQGHTAEFTAAVRRRLPAVRQALQTQYDSAFALLQAVS